MYSELLGVIFLAVALGAAICETSYWFLNRLYGDAVGSFAALGSALFYLFGLIWFVEGRFPSDLSLAVLVLGMAAYWAAFHQPHEPRGPFLKS
jgi:hypothetical protein